MLRDTRPRAFLLENVPGMAFNEKSEGLRLLLDGIAAIDRAVGTSYRPAVAKLNAAHYGVPQLRERVFPVGSRDGTGFRFPSPTHADRHAAGLVDQGLEPPRTAWDALGDLPESLDDPALAMRGKWAALLPTVPEGENYLWHTSRGGGERIFGWRTRFWSFLLMLGNAVPSLLAEVLAREIRRQLLADVEGLAPAPTLMPPRRTDTPGPELPAPLPKQYRNLIGHHEDHPGTGLGPGARGRAAAGRDAPGPRAYMIPKRAFSRE